MNDELMNEREVAERLGVHVITVRKWRAIGYGPPALKIPRHPLRGYNVRYRPADVEAFLNQAVETK